MQKKNLAKAKVQLRKIQAQAKLELPRHKRALKLAAKRYRVALKNSHELGRADEQVQRVAPALAEARAEVGGSRGRCWRR